jgi:hypothetical protein
MDAQELAMRVWGGQSASLTRNERISRIERALREQGLGSSGVTYPQHEPLTDGSQDEPEGWRNSLQIDTTGIV